MLVKARESWSRDDGAADHFYLNLGAYAIICESGLTGVAKIIIPFRRYAA